MRNPLFGSLLAVAAAFASPSVTLAQRAPRPAAATPQSEAAPRLANGKPDLSGVWSRASDRSSYGAGFKDIPPMTPWGAEKYKALMARRDKDETRNLIDPIITACAPAGTARGLQQGRPFEIFEVPGRVLIVSEVDARVRHVWMDGRGHPKDADPNWFGHSIGRWDNDTLVVDTVGFNELTWLDGEGHPHSEALHIVERFHRVNKDLLEVDVTYDDPKTYTKPWVGKLAFESKPNWELIEWISCDDRIQRQLKADACDNPSWESAVGCGERRRLKPNEK
jgi:hypothetical protein